MRKKIEKIPENGFVVHLYDVKKFEYHIGRTMTLIEALGLSETQEKAFKDIIKQEIWSLWDYPWGTEIKTSTFGDTTEV